MFLQWYLKAFMTQNCILKSQTTAVISVIYCLRNKKNISKWESCQCLPEKGHSNSILHSTLLFHFIREFFSHYNQGHGIRKSILIHCSCYLLFQYKPCNHSKSVLLTISVPFQMTIMKYWFKCTHIQNSNKNTFHWLEIGLHNFN